MKFPPLGPNTCDIQVAGVATSVEDPGIHFWMLLQFVHTSESYWSEETHQICSEEDRQHIARMAGQKIIWMFLLLGLLLCLSSEVQATTAMSRYSISSFHLELN